MATLEEQLAELENIKRSGVLRSSYEGKEVTYRSMADLDKAISDLKAEIAASGSRPKAKAGFAGFSRGS